MIIPNRILLRVVFATICALIVAGFAAGAVPANQVVESEHDAALVLVTATAANPEITVRIVADGKVVFDQRCRGGWVHGTGDTESPDYVQFQTADGHYRRFFAKQLTLRINGEEPPPRPMGQTF